MSGCSPVLLSPVVCVARQLIGSKRNVQSCGLGQVVEAADELLVGQFLGLSSFGLGFRNHLL